MNDIFIEQLVKKKRTVKDNIIFIFTILMVIMVPVTLFALSLLKVIIAYFTVISFFILVAGIWVIWMVRSNQNVEYEYQVIQETLVVSKIIAKRKRKHMLKVDTKTFELLDKGSEEGFDGQHVTKVFTGCADINDKENTYYATFKHTAYGKCGLLFTPDEKILNAMKPYLSRDIVLKLFYKRG